MTLQYTTSMVFNMALIHFFFLEEQQLLECLAKQVPVKKETLLSHYSHMTPKKCLLVLNLNHYTPCLIYKGDGHIQALSFVSQ